MKKTLVLLLAACSSAMATDSITLSSIASGNYNQTTHGFYLSLSSDELQTATSITLPEIATLESITLKGPNAAVNSQNVTLVATYGLVVLSETDNTVLGYSTGTQTSGKNVDTTFSFTTLSGEGLTLNTADTYRFITVSSGVLDLFTDSTKTYVYNAGGTGAATTSGDTVTITQGLTAPGMRWDYNTGNSVDDCCAIFVANIGSGIGTYSPIVSSMTINLVPEPTTATLSLLALAGLAARRRRK